MLPQSRALCSSLACLAFSQTIQALRFIPNCTLPPTGTNYLSGPNTRGTVSILWNCLSIIFLCTWSVQHLNVPAMRPQSKSAFQKMWWAVLDSRTKIKWMIFTVLIPEFIIGKALNDLLLAKEPLQTSKFDLVWDEVHAHMANMGYFVVDFGQYLLEANESDEDRGEVKVEQEGYGESEGPPASDSLLRQHHRPYDLNNSETFEFKIAQADYSLRKIVQQALLDGSHEDDIPTSARINLSRMAHRYWAPSGRQLSLLVPHIIDFPSVHARQLEVLNRGDALVKVLALVQILYVDRGIKKRDYRAFDPSTPWNMRI